MLKKQTPSGYTPLDYKIKRLSEARLDGMSKIQTPGRMGPKDKNCRRGQHPRAGLRIHSGAVLRAI
jgi:hypothetical protein